MKYFEKDASATEILKGVLKGVSGKKDAYAKIDKVIARKKRLMSLEHKRPAYFEKNIEQIGSRVSELSKVIQKAEGNVNIMRARAKLATAPVHPMQGTMLNVQTRDAQRKYKSKVLGKKKADILVPLWR
jgi:hypothetical protein